MEEKIICVFGASTTLGLWDTEKGGWVNRLRLYIDNKSSEDEYNTVYNLGVDGDSTNDLLERFYVECEARDPDIIIFSIGGNDSCTNSNGEFLVSIDKFEKNIKELIKLAKKFTDKIIFLGLYPFDESKTKPVSWNKEVNYKNKDLEDFDKKLREISKIENVRYIDIFDLFSLDYFEDGVHLNSKGHEKLFNKVKDYLEG